MTLESQKLPSGWIAGCLADYVQPRNERVSPQEFPELPFIGMDHVESQSTRIVGSVPASQMKSSAARFLAHDVIYGRLRPYLNKVAQPTFDGLASAEFMVFPSHAMISPLFLKHRLNAADFVSFASQLNEGDRPRVSFDQIGAFPILLPPLKEQERIAAKIEELFSELDKGIESLKTAHQQLEAYRQAVLKAAFEGKLTTPWRQDNKEKLEQPAQLLARLNENRQRQYGLALGAWRTAINEWEAGEKQGKKPRMPTKPAPVELPTPMLMADLPNLPEGWCWMRVGNICDVVRGGSPRPAGDLRYYEGTIPFLKVADLTRTPGIYLDSHTYTIKEAGLEKTRLVEPPILLLSNSGATLGVPKICRIQTTFNDGIAAFLGLSEEDLLYHYYFWASKTAALRGIDQGAAQPNLNTDLIADVLIPMCSVEEMRAVVFEVERSLTASEQLLADIAEHLTRANALRESIFREAFAGRLVRQDPSDEAATLLLERIARDNVTNTRRVVGKRTARKKRKTAA